LNAWISREFASRYNLQWMAPFGYSRSFAILVRGDDPRFARIATVSDLREMIMHDH
jgi:glycine betaine/choline ABC-type transport system substrate-binding protein